MLLCSTQGRRRDSSAVAVRHAPRLVLTGSNAVITASFLFDGRAVNGGLSCSPLRSILFATFSCFYWSEQDEGEEAGLLQFNCHEAKQHLWLCFRREQTEEQFLSCSTWNNQGSELFSTLNYFILLSFLFFLAPISFFVSSSSLSQLRKKLKGRAVETSRIDRCGAVGPFTNKHILTLLMFPAVHWFALT